MHWYMFFPSAQKSKGYSLFWCSIFQETRIGSRLLAFWMLFLECLCDDRYVHCTHKTDQIGLYMNSNICKCTHINIMSTMHMYMMCISCTHRHVLAHRLSLSWGWWIKSIVRQINSEDHHVKTLGTRQPINCRSLCNLNCGTLIIFYWFFYFFSRVSINSKISNINLLPLCANGVSIVNKNPAIVYS